MHRSFSSFRRPTNRTAISGVFALSLVACAQEPARGPEATESATTYTPPGSIARTVPSEVPAAETVETLATPNVLTLEGLDTLKISQPIPKGGSWSERGAQLPGPCRTVSSPDYLGVYAIVEGGKVRRITVGGESEVKLTEGVGIGSNEAEVREAFPGFRDQPHKYVASPAKYLTAPEASAAAPGLRFEISIKQKVSLMHVGTMPILGYVEGCG